MLFQAPDTRFLKHCCTLYTKNIGRVVKRHLKSQDILNVGQNVSSKAKHSFKKNVDQILFNVGMLNVLTLLNHKVLYSNVAVALRSFKRLCRHKKLIA